MTNIFNSLQISKVFLHLTKLGKVSLCFVRSYRVSAKAQLTLSSELEEIIIGTILGDLSVEKPNKNCNTRLQFKQSIINKEYVDHLYTLFSEFCGKPHIGYV